MATPLQICTLALSKLGISGGARKPRQVDLDLALDTLKDLYSFYVTSGALGRAINTVLNEPMDCYVAHENERILRASEDVEDIQLPLTITRESFNNLDYNSLRDVVVPTIGSRAPRHGAFVVVNDAFTSSQMIFIYDGHSNQWCTVNDLTLDEDSFAPLMVNTNGAAARLAVMLADHFSADLHPVTARDALMFDAALVQAMGEFEDIVPGTYF